MRHSADHMPGTKNIYLQLSRTVFFLFFFHYTHSNRKNLHNVCSGYHRQRQILFAKFFVLCSFMTKTPLTLALFFFSLVASKPPAESLERLLMLRQQNNIHMQIYRHTL